MFVSLPWTGELPYIIYFPFNKRNHHHNARYQEYAKTQGQTDHEKFLFLSSPSKLYKSNRGLHQSITMPVIKSTRKLKVRLTMRNAQHLATPADYQAYDQGTIDFDSNQSSILPKGKPSKTWA